jgi:uncharacterized RDD family membrane protein YckC
MTQQDETARGAAADQTPPSFPSPYLEASEAAPEAYPAPAQPDQPKYGTPPPYRTRVQTNASGAQPYARQGYGQQSGYGQTGYRQAGSRPVRGTLRDPALAAPAQRLAASFVDWLIIYIVSMLLYWSPLLKIAREMRAILANAQGQASPAAQAAVNGLLADPTTQRVLLYWLLTMFGLALAYYWVQHAAWGATVGKRALGLRVVQATDQRRVGIKAAGIRAVTFLAGPAMLLLLVYPINVVGGVLWAADAGFTTVDLRAQCLHDKLAGTIVIRKRWLDQQARSTSH